MSGTHSLDLRERVIAAWQQGEGKSAIARRFMLGFATVRRYIERIEASGSLKARPHGGGAPRKVDEAGEAIIRQLVCERATRRTRSLRASMRNGPGAPSATRRSIGRCGAWG